ncbi:hypothetical protein SEA_TUNATARTARE_134 [Streptomyces phage TunaTartare]|jgi:hypothetical protein|uniref:Uncharacterized protein n=1 Tax=Streptomyces phage TunaTartare TaxID=2848887 RepID=A0A8F2E6P6_9CAUD|nr:hypothetical protein PP457_gp134 [Streptomyces phage TunaTartare]QWT30008.1 hypothetical protein SEA_TUNATARTARE_134 [Streptomyces phage TunaTartare]
MKVTNLYIYGNSEYLRRLEEDYVFMGRQVRLEDDRLIVFALPKRRNKQKVQKRNRRRR